MFYSTMSRSRWLSVIMMAVLLIAMFGPLRNYSAAQSEQPDSQQQMLPNTNQAVASIPDTSNSVVATQSSGPGQQVVRERLSKMKSPQELMENNKLYPVLHQDISQFDTVEVMATGYYAGVESTGKKPGHPQYGITYSGVKVRKGILSTIAADPKVFPLGTILYIPGYGYGIVADTGSAIKGKKIDLYYESKAQIYKEWGKRKVHVRVVQMGNGKVSEQTLLQWNDIMTAVEMEKELPYPL
ncbi:MAG: hypothetical protein K0R67_2045 [Paenibacillus sp.]|nr:hypothetical protein [Paenibacillus sp.]